MRPHEKARGVENEARKLANLVWLRITAMFNDEQPGVQQLAAIYLSRELCQHVIQLHHQSTEDPDGFRLEDPEEEGEEETSED